MDHVPLQTGKNYLVIWDSLTQGIYYRSLYGQYFDKYGNKTGSEFLIDGGADVFKGRDIASNGSSYFVVYDNYYSGLDVYGVLYDNEGNILKGKQRINSYASSDQRTPSIVSDGKNYLVMWYSANQDGSSYGAYARLYDNEGNCVNRRNIFEYRFTIFRSAECKRRK